MIRHFLKSLVTLILVFLLTSSVYASGKMELPLGQKVTLEAGTAQAGHTYKWIAKLGRDIVATQTGSVFTYTFSLQGEYKVSLTDTDASGAVKSSVVDILVGDRYSTPSSVGTSSGTDTSFIDSPLRVEVATLPTLTSEQTVHIAGDEGRVAFAISTRPDILEYRIDKNLYVDSDGNGIANDDIDNASHSSYLLGGVWQTKYEAGESNRIAAEITVVNTQGQKAKTQVEIIFASQPSKEGNVVAILDTLPATSAEDGKIRVYGDGGNVAFYATRSQGDIIEYRIDKNIFVDSDGDGNPSNDIDNRSDVSFKTGDVWVADYAKTEQQVISQLIVVGQGGAGSRIQREVIFEEAPIIEVDEPSVPSSVIQLTADKDFAQKGDPVVFTVEGLSQSLDAYSFSWDFDGNEEVDQIVEGDNTVTYIYDTAAIHPVKVMVMDTSGNEASFNLDFLVKDITATKADFDYTVDGLTVNFENLSEVSQSLTSRVLNYQWNFGETDVENYEAQKDKFGAESPSFTYAQSGTYIVALTVVDSDSVTDTKTAEITVEGSVEVSPDEGVDSTDGFFDSEDESSGGSLIGSIFKIVLYVILAVLVLGALIVMGLLVFLKLQHPDLVFEELVDEMKIKLLGMMGVHDLIDVPEDDVPPQAEAVAQEPEVKVEPKAKPAPAPKVEPEVETAPEHDLAKPDAPMPDWLKPKADMPVAPKPDVIEGEVVEDSVSGSPAGEAVSPVQEVPTPPKAPTPKAPPTPETPPTEDTPPAGKDLSEPDGPVPDWLKQ